MQVFAEQQAHQGEVDDSLGGAEVAAVHAREEESGHQQGTTVRTDGGAVACAAGAQGGGEPGLEDDEDERHGDQGGHDRVEGVGGQHQEEGRADQPAGQGRGAEAPYAASLAGQFAAVAEGAAERTGHQAEGVGDVGGDRWQSDGQQDREGDQGSGADDDVDRAGRTARAEDGERFPDGHTGSLVHDRYGPA